MANIDTLKSKLTAIANAIRQKTGRSALLDLDEMPPEILSIDGGGGGNVPNPDDPLLLVDWDGTLLYSYTYEDAQQISEFPDPPTHDGLTFQSWNWSEVIAKTWLQNHRGEQLKVGAVYTPTDGQDHNYWRSPRLTLSNQIYMQHRATTSVENNAFYEYYSLMSISLPNGLTCINSNVFQNCYSLTSVNLPSSVTSIGNYAFQNCYSLTSVNLPNGLTCINSNVFQNCYSLTSVNLPNGVTSINSNVFRNCYSLTSVNLPNGLTIIAANAFQNCCSLTSIILPNSLMQISGNVFAYCYSLPKIDIPASVTLIGSYAFNDCSSLADVVIRGKPTLDGSSVFSNNPSNQRFYVHRSDLEWYSTATNWSAIYGEGKIVAAADYIEYLQSIGIDTTDFEGE